MKKFENTYCFYYEVHHTDNTVKHFATREALFNYLYNAQDNAQNITIQRVYCDYVGVMQFTTIATYAIPKQVLDYAQKMKNNAYEYVDALFAQNITAEECSEYIARYNAKMRPLIDKQLAHIIDIEVL